MGAFKFAKTVLKSTFKKPATLMYPVVEREQEEVSTSTLTSVYFAVSAEENVRQMQSM